VTAQTSSLQYSISNILNIVVRVFVKMLSVKNSDIASLLEPGH